MKKFKHGKCPICDSSKVKYSNKEFYGDSDEILADWDCCECNSYGSVTFKLTLSNYDNAYNGADDEELDINIYKIKKLKEDKK